MTEHPPEVSKDTLLSRLVCAMLPAPASAQAGMTARAATSLRTCVRRPSARAAAMCGRGGLPGRSLHTIDEDEVEQYSSVSAERLQEAAERLVAAVRSYTTEAITMRGGTSELAALFQRNEVLEAVVDAFAEAAFDHTGTSPFVLSGKYDDDEPYEVDDDEEDEPPVSVLSVVRRWDVAVSSRDSLLEAGRAAHRRDRPEETAEDAAAAVSNEAGALYAVLHERGEPWFHIPGIQVVSGVRAYVQPSSAVEPHDGDPDTLMDALRAPEGSVVYGESW